MQLEAEEMKESGGLRFFLRYWALVIRKHYAASRQVEMYWQVELWWLKLDLKMRSWRSCTLYSVCIYVKY